MSETTFPCIQKLFCAVHDVHVRLKPFLSNSNEKEPNSLDGLGRMYPSNKKVRLRYVHVPFSGSSPVCVCVRLCLRV